MSGLRCCLAGPALLGPGLPGWEASRAMLAGTAPWREAPTEVPPPALLAPNERRRASLVVRLALAAAGAAAEAAGLPPDSLDTVFASANGDGAVVGAILESLADPAGAVSPTQFHNSVHNAPAGYWGIAARSGQPSVSLGCHRDSLPMGLLQAAARSVALARPVLFCAYDAPLPEPLAPLQPTAFPFAMACILTPAPIPASLAWLGLRHHGLGRPPAAPPGPWDALAEGNPAARALPLLARLAAVAATPQPPILLPLLEGGWLELALAPC